MRMCVDVHCTCVTVYVCEYVSMCDVYGCTLRIPICVCMYVSV